MMIKSTNLKRGDLCAVSDCGRLYPYIFYKDTGHSLQFVGLHKSSLDDLKKGIKPNIFYISGRYYYSRVVKISEDALDPTDLASYQEFIKI